MRKRLATTIILVFAFSWFIIAQAYGLPQGQSVETGSATFSQPDSNTLIITAADNTVINFNSFDIGANESVSFIQPSSTASVLSRVNGGILSVIAGILNANGRLFLVNPAGISFTATAQVQAGSLTASTLDISTNNFIKGNYIFERKDGTIYAQVLNEGRINADNIALIANAVNNNGIILAKAGTVSLVSGDKTTVSFDARGLIHVEVNAQTSAKVFDNNGVSVKDAVANSGTITAREVYMTADTALGIFKNAVNQSGIVRASGIAEEGGVIRLTGSGDIQASGTLDSGAGRVVVETSESVAVNSRLNTTGKTDVTAGKDIKVNADIVTTSGDLSLLSDNDFDGVGSFLQALGTAISTLISGDITIQASGESTLANINSAGDLILKKAGAPVNFTQQVNSAIATNGSLKINPGVTLTAADAVYSVGRDWSNFGKFVPGTSTVRFTGLDAARIFGSNEFFNLIIDTPQKSVGVEPETTQSIINNLVLRGSYGKLLAINSIEPGKQWNLLPLGTTDISYISLGNCIKIRGPPLETIHSNSLGNNINCNLGTYWTGQGPTGNWSDPDNWDTGAVPTAFDAVTFNGISGLFPDKDSYIDVNFGGTIAKLTVNGYKGALSFGRDLTVAGDIAVNSGTILNPSGSKISSQYGSIYINTHDQDITIKGGLYAYGNIDIYAGMGNIHIDLPGIFSENGSINLEMTKGNIIYHNGAYTSAPQGQVRLWTCGDIDLRKGDVISKAGGFIQNPDDVTYVSWTGGGGNNLWANAANWTGGVVPNSNIFNVTIDFAGATVTTAVGYTIGALTIGGTNASQLTLGGTMITSTVGLDTGAVTVNSNGTLNCSTFLLTVGGNLTVNGVLSGSGGVTLSGAAGATISGTGNISNTGTFTIDTGSKSITAGSNLTFSGTIAIIGAITVTNNGVVTTTAAGGITGSVAGSTWVNGANSTLNITGPLLATGTLTATASPNTVNYNGAAQTVKATTYYNLTVSGGAKTVGGAITVNGNLTVSSGSLTTAGSAFTVNGTTSVPGGTLTFTNNTGAKTLVGLVTVSGGTMNGASNNIIFRGGITQTSGSVAITGTATFNTNNQALSGTISINTLTVNVVTLTNNGTLTVSTALSGTGGLTNAATGTLNIGGTSGITTLTATAVGNTVNYNGAGQTVKAATYYNLILSNSGTKTAGGALTVNGDFTTSGTTIFAFGAFSHIFKGNWTINSTNAAPITATAGSTVSFNTPDSPAATAIINGSTTAVLPFVTLNINNTSGFSCNENITVSGTMTIASGVIFTPGATNTIAGAGTLTGAGTAQVTRTAATADFLSQYTITNKTYANLTVEYCGAGPQTVNNVGYGHLKINNSGNTATLGGITAITGNLTISPGAVFSTSYNIGVGGNWSNSGTFNALAGTVIFNNITSVSGSSTTTFNHLQLGTALTGGSLIFLVDATVNGNFSVLNGGATTLDITGRTVSFKGNVDLTNLDTFTVTGSTIILSGTGAQSLTSAGKTYNSLTVTNASLAGVTFTDGFTTVNFTDTTPSSLLTFKDGATYTITGGAGALNLNGGAVGTRVTLRSFAPGTRFTFDLTGSDQSVDYVDVRDSNVTTHKIYAGHSVGANTNANWIFSTGNIRFWVGTGAWNNNANWSTVSGGAGGASFPVAGDDAIFDGNGTGNLTLTANAAAGTLSLHGAGDPNLAYTGIFNANGQAVTVSGLTRISGGTYQASTATQAFNGGLTVSGGIFTGSTGAVDVTNVILSSGTLTAPSSGAFTISGNWTVSGGTFNANAGTVTFDGTTNLTSFGISFNNIQIGSASSGGILALLDNMDINGNLTVLNGGPTTFDITNRRVNFSGDVTFTSLDTFIIAGSTVIFDGTSNVTNAGFAFNNMELGSPTAGGSLKYLDTADLNGSFIANNGGATSLDVSGVTYSLGGDIDLTNLDAFIWAGSTAIFDGTTNLMGTALAADSIQLGSATSGGSLRLLSSGTVYGNFTVNNGGATTLDITGCTVSFKGNVDLTNLDTFTVTGSTVVLSGAGLQSLTSAGKTYNSLTVTNASLAGVTFTDGFTTVNFTDTTPSSLLTFKDGATYTISDGAGSLNLNGGAAGTRIKLRSSTPGVRFTINVSGSDQSVDYVDVQDSNATGEFIYANNSVGANTNANWVFAPGNIRFWVGSSGGAWNNNANWSAISGGAGGATFPVAGDSAIFDGNGTNNITLTASAAAYLLELQGAGDPHGAYTGIFNANGQAVTVSGLTKISGGTYQASTAAQMFNGGLTVSGGIFTGSTGDINVTNVTLSSGTLTAPSSGVFTVSGAWTVSGTGAFNANGGTVTFDGTTDLTSNGTSFNNVRIGTGTSGGSLTLLDNMDINGNFTVMDGGFTTFLDITNRTVNFAGSVDFTNLDAFIWTGSTVIFDGTTSLTSAGYTLNDIQLGTASTGGSLTLLDDLIVDGNFTVLDGGATAFTITGRTVSFQDDVTLTNLDIFTVNGSTVIFYGTTNLTAAGQKFNDVQIGTVTGGGYLKLVGDMDIEGDLTITNGGFTTFDITNSTVCFDPDVDLTNLDIFTVTGSTACFYGATNLTSAGKAFNNIELGKIGTVTLSTLTLVDNLDVNGSFTVLNDGPTTFDITNRTVNFSKDVDLANLDTFIVAGSTAVFDGTTSLTATGQEFNDVQIGTATGGGSLAVVGDMDIHGNLTVQNGGFTTFDITNSTVCLAGDVDLTDLDTFTVTGSTVCFYGTTNLTSAGKVFNNIELGMTGVLTASTLTLVDNLDVNGNFTVLNDGPTTFDITNRTVNFSKDVDLANLDTFIIAGSKAVFDGTTSLTAAGQEFNDVQIGTATGGGSLAVVGDMDIHGNLTVQNGGFTTFDITNSTVCFAGDVDFTNLDTFTVTGSTACFYGTTNLISAGKVFNNIELGMTGVLTASTLTLVDNLDVNGSFTVLNDGPTTFDITNHTVNFSKDVDLANLDTFTVTGSTVVFDGTTALTSAGRSFNNIQLGAGGSLTLADQADINGNFSVAGGAGTSTFDISNQNVYFSGAGMDLTNLDNFITTGSTVIFDGTTNLTSAGRFFNNVQLGAGGSLTLADQADINGDFSVAGGAGTSTFDISSQNVYFSGASIDLTNLDNFIATGSTWIFDGTTNLTSAGNFFDNITIGTNASSGSLTLADNADINGLLTFNSTGGTAALDSTNRTVNYAGATLDLTDADTFTSTGSTWIFDGTTNLTSAGKSFNNITIGTNTSSGSLALADNADINGLLTFNSTGGTAALDSANRTVNYAGATLDLTDADTFTSTGSTWIFDGTTNLTSAGNSFNNVQLGAGGSLTLADQADINGDFSVAGGAGTSTFDISSQNVYFSGASIDLTNLDNFITTGSTVIFDGAGVQALNSSGSALAFNNLTHSGGGTLQLVINPINIDGNFINSGGTFDANGRAMSVAGDWSNTAIFSANSNTVTFDGAAVSTISGSTTFYDLSCATAGKILTFTRGTTQTVTHGLTLTGTAANPIIMNDTGAGAVPQLTLQAGAGQSISNVNVTNNDASGGIALVARGTSSLSGTTTNWALGSSGITFTWTGAVSTDWNTPGNWDLGLVPTAGDTVVIPLTANQPALAGNTSLETLTINAGATLSTGGNNLTVNGDVIINGTLNAGASTIIVSGNITTDAAGMLAGTSPTLIVNGYVGMQGNPIQLNISGTLNLFVSGMQGFVSVSVTGAGNINWQGTIPGFVVSGGALLPHLGQAQIRALLGQGESVLYGCGYPRYPSRPWGAFLPRALLFTSTPDGLIPIKLHP